MNVILLTEEEKAKVAVLKDMDFEEKEYLFNENKIIQDEENIIINEYAIN